MYEAGFSKLYNEYGWNTFAEMFAGQLLQWIEQRCLSVRTALDLGCGTGVLCAALTDAGIQMTGVDISENMLALARENCPNADFFAADIVTFEPGKSFDMILSTGDVLNHVPDPNDVRKVFENVYKHLVPGGVFIFDIMGHSGLQDGDSFELDDGSRFEFERPDQNKIMMHISVTGDDGKVSHETVTETIHDPQKLEGMLGDVGFKRVECVRQLLPGFEHPEGALYFIAYS